MLWISWSGYVTCPIHIRFSRSETTIPVFWGANIDGLDGNVHFLYNSGVEIEGSILDKANESGYVDVWLESESLLNKISEIRPNVCIFGHHKSKICIWLSFRLFVIFADLKIACPNIVILRTSFICLSPQLSLSLHL